MWAIVGARSPNHARSIIAWRIRRRLGWAVLNANALLKIQRCDFVGPGGAETARRRHNDVNSRNQRRRERWYDIGRTGEEAQARGQGCYTAHRGEL